MRVQTRTAGLVRQQRLLNAVELLLVCVSQNDGLVMRLQKRSDTISSAIAVGYTRISKDELGSHSLDSQKDLIERWSIANALPVLAVHEDQGIGGAVPPADRPGLAAAVLAVKAHRADFLVVSARDRLSRDVLNTLLLERELEALDPPCRIVTAAEDPNAEPSPESKVMATIVDAFAEYERAKIRARTKEGVRKAREQGRVAGPQPWSKTTRGQATIQLVKHCKRIRCMSNAEIVSFCRRHEVYTPHRGYINPGHVRRALQVSDETVPPADLGETAESLAAAVKRLSYCDTRFVKRSA